MIENLALTGIWCNLRYHLCTSCIQMASHYTVFTCNVHKTKMTKVFPENIHIRKSTWLAVFPHTCIKKSKNEESSYSLFILTLSVSLFIFSKVMGNTKCFLTFSTQGLSPVWVFPNDYTHMVSPPCELIPVFESFRKNITFFRWLTYIQIFPTMNSSMHLITVYTEDFLYSWQRAFLNCEPFPASVILYIRS